MSLTAEQVSKFETDGFLSYGPFFGPEEVAESSAYIEEAFAIADAAGRRDDTRVREIRSEGTVPAAAPSGRS